MQVICKSKRRGLLFLCTFLDTEALVHISRLELLFTFSVTDSTLLQTLRLALRSFSNVM